MSLNPVRSTYMTPTDTRLHLIGEMQKVLSRAAQERRERPDLVDDPIGPWPGQELEWVLYEREQLLTAVNVERASRGLPEAALSDVKRVEQMAVGHTDYGHKFSIYCAELAMGETEIRP